MKIQVTQEDIDGADPRGTHDCAVAKALRRQGYPDAWVGVEMWWSKSEEKRFPPSVPRFIRALSKGPAGVQPFEFEVDDG